MPRLFWPNFDFEHELARGASWQASNRLLELNSSLAHCFCSVARVGDVIVIPRLAAKEMTIAHPQDVLHAIRLVDSSHVTTDDQFRGPDWELIPWGVTPSLEQLAITRNWLWQQPDCDLVRRLNDRQTTDFWEVQTETLPDGVEEIRSIQDFQSIISCLDRENWVLKARFGMSGRERILGAGRSITLKQSGWLEKRLKQQEFVYFEPWFDSVGEVGIQFQIPASGDIELRAVLPLINSPHSEYRGSRLFLENSELKSWEPAIHIAHQIAEEFQQDGYFGPLGIDAMQYREYGELKLRPVQDINARWTMGRIAWEFGRRLLSTDRRATWYQGQKADELLHDPAVSNRLIRTSPANWPTESIISTVLLTE